MVRRIAFFALLLAAAPLPALAAESCMAPFAPQIPDGAKATHDQIASVRDEVTAFIKQAQEYQKCMELYRTQMTQQADKNRLDPAVKKDIDAKEAANDREYQRVGQQFNAAVRAYNKAHPAN